MTREMMIEYMYYMQQMQYLGLYRHKQGGQKSLARIPSFKPPSHLRARPKVSVCSSGKVQPREKCSRSMSEIMHDWVILNWGLVMSEIKTILILKQLLKDISVFSRFH